ncbi:ATP-binding cassette domain-containing protein, partial [Rhizobium leguminosarum]|nr:ATP-binding cassette domain-containing protein [Rhizobium leguminosarum]
ANTTTIRFNPHIHNKQLKKLFNLEANAWELYNFLFYLLYLIQDFIFYLGACITFCLLMFDYSQGIIGADKMILIYGLIASIHSPLVEITRNLTRFFGGFIDINKTLDIFNLPSENKPLQLTNFSTQTIQIKQLSFSYNKSQKLLEDINLDIIPGDKIGIFGPSGRGKSTLCQIIAGLIEPDEGNVLYGNLPITQINPISLGKVLRYVPQINPMQTLYEETHLYGINLKKAAFSGGEYQLHLLQEALQSNPQIIILDEAINALDKTSAKKILTEILHTIPTVIMVSHSHTLLSNMKRIFELKDGQLVETKNS